MRLGILSDLELNVQSLRSVLLREKYRSLQRQSEDVIEIYAVVKFKKWKIRF